MQTEESCATPQVVRDVGDEAKARERAKKRFLKGVVVRDVDKGALFEGEKEDLAGAIKDSGWGNLDDII